MNSTRQRLAILGSTGSVGTSTLDVVARHADRFEIVGLTSYQRTDLLVQQCLKFRPRVAVLPTPERAAEVRAALKAAGSATEVQHGASALCELAAADDVDSVMASIVGAAGLSPCMAAARAGKRLLLANKEALVVGGALFMQAVKNGGATLLPIDSEHSAIFQCLPEDRSTWARRIDHIILTASGGPFRQRDPETLHEVTPAQAVAHPNWVMGRKISVDCATMMNKALEVVEAHYLFNVAPAQIDVVIHPQSVVHSMVQYRDASVVAQLGTADMRGPIAYGLSWPARMVSGAAALDFTALPALTFESIHTPEHKARFPGLQLAWQALAGPSGSTAVLNAANEVAVEAFLAGRVRFDQIHVVNAETTSQVHPAGVGSLDDLLALDEMARRAAASIVRRLKV